MCEFISWIEHDGKNWYLTKSELNSAKGKELLEYCGCAEDLVGHGAIRHYHDFDGGFDKELADFSDPSRFPAEIVQAMKDGLFEGMGLPMEVLTPEAQAEYDKIVQPAWAEYEKIWQSARAEYDKIVQSARAEYKKTVQSARAEYDKIEQPAQAEYEKIEQPAQAEYKKIAQSARAEYLKIVQPARAAYEKIAQPAWVEYEKIWQSARAEYDKIEQSAFWTVFKNPSNRTVVWR